MSEQLTFWLQTIPMSFQFRGVTLKNEGVNALVKGMLVINLFLYGEGLICLLLAMRTSKVYGSALNGALAGNAAS